MAAVKDLLTRRKHWHETIYDNSHSLGISSRICVTCLSGRFADSYPAKDWTVRAGETPGQVSPDDDGNCRLGRVSVPKGVRFFSHRSRRHVLTRIIASGRSSGDVG